ncbi:MAG: PTS sugar transporter subunit IIA [Candidatus Aminicenantes bacterium]|nr:PTS sugar transporter subunit IIA [Candidatus Aminicenantes bacterium]
MIIPDLEARDKDEALQEMVSYLKSKNKEIKENELYEKLLQREKLGSTAIGEGVAIPHCKLKNLKDSILLLGVSKKGIDFNSLDNKATYAMFLVVSSPDNPSLNLQILAGIAHIVRKAKSLIKKIQNANTRREILDIIREEEEKLNE